MLKTLLTFVLMISTVNAKEDNIRKWHIKLGTGLNYLTLPTDAGEKIDVKTGVYTNLTIGYQFDRNLHGEIESALRKNEGVSLISENILYPVTGTIYTYSGLMNMLLDFPFQDFFVFSIGIGGGIHSTDGKFIVSGPFFLEQPYIRYRTEGAACQGIMRLQMDFTPRFGGCIECKHLYIPNCNHHNTVGMNLKIVF